MAPGESRSVVSTTGRALLCIALAVLAVVFVPAVVMTPFAVLHRTVEREPGHLRLVRAVSVRGVEVAAVQVDLTGRSGGPPVLTWRTYQTGWGRCRVQQVGAGRGEGQAASTARVRWRIAHGVRPVYREWAAEEVLRLSER